jgi:hypothetical protein
MADDTLKQTEAGVSPPSTEPPHTLPLVYYDNEIDWRAWAEVLLSAIRSAANIDEVDVWLRQNDSPLAEAEKAAPKMVKFLKAAIDRHRAKLCLDQEWWHGPMRDVTQLSDEALEAVITMASTLPVMDVAAEIQRRTNRRRSH